MKRERSEVSLGSCLMLATMSMETSGGKECGDDVAQTMDKILGELEREIS